MVKSEADLLGTTGLQLETVFCTFKQPESPFNKLDVEKRVGFLKLDKRGITLPSLNKSTASSCNNISVNNSDTSSGRLIFHLQVKSINFRQRLGNPVVFDDIIYNWKNSYNYSKVDGGAFFAPVAGKYKFVFEAKVVLSGKNVTFQYAGRSYRNATKAHGWKLIETGPYDFMKNNTVKMVATSDLNKSTRIQLKTLTTLVTNGTYVLSAGNTTSFKGYLLP